MHMLHTLLKLAPAAALVWTSATAAAEPAAPASQSKDAAAPSKASTAKQARHHPKRQVGKASFYGREFFGRKMANGRRMDPNADNAASRTLPLGTKARVTNLETGKSSVVTIEDRGPYVDGRIVDLSPATAEKIGLERKQGLAPVEVVPLDVPEQTAEADLGNR